MIDRYNEINIEKGLELGLIPDDEYRGDKDSSPYSSVYIDTELSNKDKVNIIEYLDFKVIKNKDKTIQLKDLQGANLADIELDVFNNLDEALERLEVYLNDYKIAILTEEEFNSIKK